MKKLLIFVFIITGLTLVAYGAYFPSITINDGQLDGFSRISVAQPTTLFDSQFSYDLQPFIWQTNCSNKAYVTNLFNECAVSLNTTTDNNSRAIMQTYQYFRYQPGKAQQIFTTFVMNPARSNVVRRVGYYDANDGIFLEQNSTTDVAIVRRSSVSGTPVDTRVVQTNWNKDVFNGTGISGVNLDLSTAQILIIDLQFLGVGRVRVGFDVNGIPYWAHQFTHANSLTNVYMRTANLPLRVEQIAMTNAPVADMKQICSAVISSGGFEDDRGIPFCAGNTNDISLSSGVPTLALAIRPKAAYNGQVNRGTIIPLNFDVLGGAGINYYQVFYGGTNSGSTWISTHTNSIVEYTVTGTVPTNSVLIDAGYVAIAGGGARYTAAASFNSRMPIALDMNGSNAIPVYIVVTGFATSTTRVNLNWKELK